MSKLMSDRDVLGQFQRLILLSQTSPWLDVWLQADMEIATFAHEGLANGDSEETVWALCQQRNIVLIIANRTVSSWTEITASDAPWQSLPFVILKDPDRILHDAAYTEHALERLLDVVMDVENVRGTGCLYLP